MKMRLKNIKDAKKVFDDNGIIFWICDGTLLGAFREKGFIRWDNETDIDMFEEELLANYDLLKDCFLSCGFIVRGHNRVRGSKMNIYRGREKISIRGLYLNPEYKEDTYRMSRSYQYPKTFFEKFDTISLKGVELRTPYPIKEYIYYVYGPNWKKPMKSKKKCLRDWLKRGVRRKSKDRRRYG
jgi:phosphorylcholine metabolism protein LicD